MAIYVVMQSGGETGKDGVPDIALVRDGFSFWAFLLPAFWLLWNRLWIEALLVFALLVGMSVLGEALGVAGTALALTLLLSVYVGLEGAALRLAALRRRGWREWGVLNAASRDEAEIRYFLEMPEPRQEAPAPWRRSDGLPRPKSSPPVDLFPFPGAR